MNMQPPTFGDITQNMTKAYEDLNAAMSSYVSAATRSNTAAWQGFETIAKDMGELMKETYARAVSHGTSLMSAKSPQQAAETHAGFVKECYEGLVAGSGKCFETSLHAAKETIDPLAKHTNETIETIMKKVKVGQA